MRYAIIIVGLVICLVGCAEEIKVGVEIKEATHHCDIIQMHCQRLSSTEKTCYPTNGTTKGKRYCRSGWIEILQPPEPEEEEKETEQEQTNKGIMWYSCDRLGCTEV